MATTRKRARAEGGARTHTPTHPRTHHSAHRQKPIYKRQCPRRLANAVPDRCHESRCGAVEPDCNLSFLLVLQCAKPPRQSPREMANWAQTSTRYFIPYNCRAPAKCALPVLALANRGSTRYPFQVIVERRRNMLCHRWHQGPPAATTAQRPARTP